MISYVDWALTGGRNIEQEFVNLWRETKMKDMFKCEKVIFNPPATIVLWGDGTKTVVKCSDNDIFDEEKGIALCFMKKATGNTSGGLNKVLHRWTEENY